MLKYTKLQQVAKIKHVAASKWELLQALMPADDTQQYTSGVLHADVFKLTYHPHSRLNICSA